MAWCGQRIGFVRSSVPNNLHVYRVLAGVWSVDTVRLCALSRVRRKNVTRDERENPGRWNNKGLYS